MLGTHQSFYEYRFINKRYFFMNFSITGQFNIGVEVLRAKDSIFSGIHQELGAIRFELKEFNLSAFCKIIIGQQLSSKAADTIFSRLQDLLKSKTISAKAILNLDKTSLKMVGISSSKIKYIVGFATMIDDNPRFCDELKLVTSDQAYEILIQLSGVGPWTANIIQLFYFGDLDVFPSGDVSLEKAYSRLYTTDLNFQEKVSYNQLKWASPYRGVLALYLWRYLDSGLLKQLG